MQSVFLPHLLHTHDMTRLSQPPINNPLFNNWEADFLDDYIESNNSCSFASQMIYLENSAFAQSFHTLLCILVGIFTCFSSSLYFDVCFFNCRFRRFGKVLPFVIYLYPHDNHHHDRHDQQHDHHGDHITHRSCRFSLFCEVLSFGRTVASSFIASAQGS